MQEIAWAAGLFEGEGCITKNGNSPALRLNSTDEETVIRFQRIIGAGAVYGPYQYNSRDGSERKPASIWVFLDAPSSMSATSSHHGSVTRH